MPVVSPPQLFPGLHENDSTQRLAKFVIAFPPPFPAMLGRTGFSAEGQLLAALGLEPPAGLRRAKNRWVVQSATQAHAHAHPGQHQPVPAAHTPQQHQQPGPADAAPPGEPDVDMSKTTKKEEEGSAASGAASA